MAYGNKKQKHNSWGKGFHPNEKVVNVCDRKDAKPSGVVNVSDRKSQKYKKLHERSGSEIRAASRKNQGRG